MRRDLSMTLLAGAAVLLAACGGEADAPAAPAAAAGGSGLMNTAEAGAAESQFTLGCGAPFTPDATPATLASVFGRENVVPETVDGPEGEQINVTAIYPNDPARRIEVSFRNEEERTGLMSVTLREDASRWIGPGGLKMGDSLEAVEAANGKPFNVSGFAWDYGGFVTEWNGGKLDLADGCIISVRLAPEAVDIAPEILGDGVQPSSDDKAVRAAKPRVTLMGIGWVQ